MQITPVPTRTPAAGDEAGDSEDIFRSLQDFIHTQHRFDIDSCQKHSGRQCGSLFFIVQGIYIYYPVIEPLALVKADSRNASQARRSETAGKDLDIEWRYSHVLISSGPNNRA